MTPGGAVCVEPWHAAASRAGRAVRTFVFRCPVCGRNPRLGEAKLLQALRGLAEIQGTDGAAPVILDISKL